MTICYALRCRLWTKQMNWISAFRMQADIKQKIFIERKNRRQRCIQMVVIWLAFVWVCICVWKKDSKKKSANDLLWSRKKNVVVGDTKIWVACVCVCVWCGNAKEKGHSCGLIFSGHLFVPVFQVYFHEDSTLPSIEAPILLYSHLFPQHTHAQI